MNIQLIPIDELAEAVLSKLKEIITLPEESDITTTLYGMGVDSVQLAELEMILEIEYKLPTTNLHSSMTCRDISLELKRLDDDRS